MRPAPPRPRMQRRWFVVGGIVLLLFISVSSIVRFYTDLLWFDELDLKAVFWKILTTRAIVGVIGGVVGGLLILVTLEVARRTAPRYRFAVAGTDIAEQYRSAFRPYARVANLGLAGVVAVFTGLSTSAMWERYLLWRNAQPFGIRAPQPFGHDVSYYVFTIPFQRAVLSWLFGITIASLLLAVLAHLLNGSIQPETNRIQIATPVKVHVSALLAVIAILKGWAYWLDRYDLVFSSRGPVMGASYTDVKVQRVALELLAVIAVVMAIVLVVNVARFRGWLLPGAALGIWIFASVLVGAVIPAAIQRFQVKPNESTREAPYIEHNIKATRQAFGIDEIKGTSFVPDDKLSEKDVAANRGTIDNVRVWDPSVLHPTYQRRQAIRTYYEFDDVDVDRYELDGELRQIMLSGREVDPSRLETNAQNWVNTKLQYTHGYGLVANTSNSVTSEGLPELLVRDLPPKGVDELLPDEPRIYYGERMGPADYAVVGTKQQEIDYPEGEQGTHRSTYAGEGGIELTSIFRRTAFALRFSDTDMMLSSFITPKSRLLMRRNIVERVATAAPFLKYDRDPYLVVAGERLVWMIDAYTTTDRFPYSQRVNLSEVVPGGRMTGSANYIRNSVKAVVDAYDGTTKFYLTRSDDAIANTYQKVFPTLFEPAGSMPAVLKQHMRYPEDLFMVQSSQFRLYHMTDPQQFYSREDAWDVPTDPTNTAEGDQPMDPYYVVMKLPGEKEEEFVMMRPFQPRNRQVLNGWLAARMDGEENYGKLVELRFPRDAQIDSPQNVSARINQTDEISEQFTLWDRAGSRVDHGPIFVIPIERTLMYVQPIYLTSENSERALPELRRVIVVVGDQIGFEATLEESLAAAIAGRGPTVEDPSTEPSTPDPVEPSAPTGDDVASLLAEATEHFDKAEAALRDGDLATYQREVDAGRRAVDEAQSRASSNQSN